MTKPRIRHIKRQSEYEVLGAPAFFQVSGGRIPRGTDKRVRPLIDGEPVIVYQSVQDGTVYVRACDEVPGRFEPVTEPSAVPPQCDNSPGLPNLRHLACYVQCEFEFEGKPVQEFFYFASKDELKRFIDGMSSETHTIVSTGAHRVYTAEEALRRVNQKSC